MRKVYENKEKRHCDPYIEKKLLKLCNLHNETAAFFGKIKKRYVFIRLIGLNIFSSSKKFKTNTTIENRAEYCLKNGVFSQDI